MMSKILFTATLLSALPFAAADFKVFCGQDINGGDGVNAAFCHFYTTPPSCSDDAAGEFIKPGGDVSFSGIACDGCDISKPILEWDITRIEVHQPDDWTTEHFTIYKGDDGTYGVYDTDMNPLGSCGVPADRQVLECSAVISNSYAVNQLDCVSSVAIV